MIAVETLDQYTSLIREPGVVVMLFSANWCSDCRYLDAFIDDVAEEYAGRLTLRKIDRDQFGDLCESLDILGIPSLIAYRDGEVAGRFVNGKRKSRQEVTDFLDDVLTNAG